MSAVLIFGFFFSCTKEFVYTDLRKVFPFNGSCNSPPPDCIYASAALGAEAQNIFLAGPTQRCVHRSSIRKRVSILNKVNNKKLLDGWLADREREKGGGVGGRKTTIFVSSFLN